MLSVLCLCIVAKRCIPEQKLLLTGSRILWEIDWYQNEWPWTLFRGRIKVTSTIALHSTLNISETVWDRGFIVSKRPPMGNGIWAIKWSRDRWRHVTLKGHTRDPNRLRAQYLDVAQSLRLCTQRYQTREYIGGVGGVRRLYTGILWPDHVQYTYHNFYRDGCLPVYWISYYF